MLVEVDCVGVVSESSDRGFVVVVVVVLEDFGLVLWCGWRMTLWCWNERRGLFATFQCDVGGREHVCGSSCVSSWDCDLFWIFGFFELVVEVA